MTQKRRAVTKRVPKNRKKRSKGATVLLSVLFYLFAYRGFCMLISSCVYGVLRKRRQ